MKVFKNVNAYVENKGVIKTDISFEDKITGFSADKSGEIIEIPADAVVLPAFIDTHVHGAGGADAMDGSREALSVIAETLAKEGTASFLATTMTQSPENIIRALSAVKEYMSAAPDTGAKILGVHLEGPFIAEKFKGAQPLEYVAAPDIKVFEKYNEAAGGAIKIVTMAPETEGAEDFIKYLAKNHIIASIGHTAAKYADVERAVAAGAKNVTHTYNAQSPLHHRDIGVVGSAMLIDGLQTEIIADTIHVSVPALKLLVKNKPADKVTLITDAMRAKGMPDGESELGGQKVFVKNGEARLIDGTLAGSVLRMNVAVKNMVLKAGVPFERAVDFASLNPAKELGIADKKGSIAPGKDADFTVLDGEFNVLMTIRAGKIIYRA